MVYLTAVNTGLSLSELVQLIVADVRLGEERSYLIAQASTTKNGKIFLSILSRIVVSEDT